jgi:hypothetical protein
MCWAGFLTGSTQAAWVWAMHLDWMYTSTVNALKISITFQNQCAMVAGQALINSRATENFINYWTAIQWRLHTKDLWCPQKVYNVDGTENQGGIISKSCVLHVWWEEQQITQQFYITNLGQDHIILGYPWLWEFNPEINWEEGWLLGSGVKLEEVGITWMWYKLEWAVIHKTHCLGMGNSGEGSITAGECRNSGNPHRVSTPSCGILGSAGNMLPSVQTGGPCNQTSTRGT